MGVSLPFYGQYDFMKNSCDIFDTGAIYYIKAMRSAAHATILRMRNKLRDVDESVRILRVQHTQLGSYYGVESPQPEHLVSLNCQSQISLIVSAPGVFTTSRRECERGSTTLRRSWKAMTQLAFKRYGYTQPQRRQIDAVGDYFY